MLRRLRILLPLLLVIATASAWVASYGGEVYEYDDSGWGTIDEDNVPILAPGEYQRHLCFRHSIRARAPACGGSWAVGAPRRRAGLQINSGMLQVYTNVYEERADCLSDASVYQVWPVLSCEVNPSDRTGRKNVEILVKIWFLFLLSVAWLCGNIYRGPLRYWRRLKRGLCVSCGYDLRGSESGVCSECGKENWKRKRGEA